jgi:hypothetical protein
MHGGKNMTTPSTLPTPSYHALEVLKDNAIRISAPVSAERLWNRYLTPQDRERLGDDFAVAYDRLGTAGMWAELRGVTPHRAVVEVAKKLGFLRNDDFEWLLRETGEIAEIEEAVADAIASRHFVLVERPREAYWNGEKINVDWNRYDVPWGFLWELGRHAKAGQPVDRLTFGDNANSDVVTKLKSRLSRMDGIPVDLVDLIKVVGRGTQQLSLSPARIRIFESSGIDTLGEWNP